MERSYWIIQKNISISEEEHGTENFGIRRKSVQRRTHFESGFLSLQKQAFIAMIKKKDQEEELYDILTVSLPGENIKINEAFISDFECKYKLSFIRKYKLGEVLQRVGHSGFCDYRLVRF